jgi:hypothetical protein
MGRKFFSRLLMYMKRTIKSIQRRAHQFAEKDVFGFCSTDSALNVLGVYGAGTVASTGVENELSWLLELTAVVT